MLYFDLIFEPKWTPVNFEDEILLRGGGCETPVVLKYDFYVKIMDFRVIFIPNNSKIPNWEFEKP